MASTSDPDASKITESRLQTRSCQKCNRRKTRCSKTQPCTSCVKLGIDCIFPPPGRAPRRKKRALKAELVSKVKALEQKVRDLEYRKDSSPSDASPYDEEASSNTHARPLVPHHHQARGPTDSARDDIEGQCGQLVVYGDSSRYVSHEALASFRTEVRVISFSYFDLG